MADLCKHCGKPESEHHAFEAMICACDVRDKQFPGQICDGYIRSLFGSWCICCGHGPACHAPKD